MVSACTKCSFNYCMMVPRQALRPCFFSQVNSVSLSGTLYGEPDVSDGNPATLWTAFIRTRPDRRFTDPPPPPHTHTHTHISQSLWGILKGASGQRSSQPFMWSGSQTPRQGRTRQQPVALIPPKRPIEPTAVLLLATGAHCLSQSLSIACSYETHPFHWQTGLKSISLKHC